MMATAEQSQACLHLNRGPGHGAGRDSFSSRVGMRYNSLWRVILLDY